MRESKKTTESENNESGCGFVFDEKLYSHESLVARANLLNENVVFGIDKGLNATIRAMGVDNWTAQ